PRRRDLCESRAWCMQAANGGGAVPVAGLLTGQVPVAATGVQVTDQLRAGVSFVADTASQGSYDNTTGMWTVGTVSTATPQTLIKNGRASCTGRERNTAGIGPAEQINPITAKKR